MSMDVSSNSHVGRRHHGNPQRSRVTNGNGFLPNGVADGRSAWVRRAKDIVAEFTADKGGDSNLSAGERSIIRRVAALTCELEMLEARFAKANGDASTSDIDLYIRGSGALRRLLEAIGLERRARSINDDVFDQVLRQELAK
jgi:hypothetical protein